MWALMTSLSGFVGFLFFFFWVVPVVPIQTGLIVSVVLQAFLCDFSSVQISHVGVCLHFPLRKLQAGLLAVFAHVTVQWGEKRCLMDTHP